MTLEQAMDFLHCTEWKGSRLGLGRMEELLNHLGNPQNCLRFIHVAGTNGKGSVCAMLSSILTQAGYQVGLYTSPHLWRINERMQICGREITDDDLCLHAALVAAASATMDDAPTEFEIITAMAFSYFGATDCDLLVLEVGLGARLHATHVCPDP